jgi:hypothetical protein
MKAKNLHAEHGGCINTLSSIELNVPRALSPHLDLVNPAHRNWSAGFFLVLLDARLLNVGWHERDVFGVGNKNHNRRGLEVSVHQLEPAARHGHPIGATNVVRIIDPADQFPASGVVVG